MFDEFGQQNLKIFLFLIFFIKYQKSTNFFNTNPYEDEFLGERLLKFYYLKMFELQMGYIFFANFWKGSYIVQSISIRLNIFENLIFGKNILRF